VTAPAEGCDAGRVRGIPRAERLIRIGPPVLCGLICGLVGAGSASWPSGLLVRPTPLASLNVMEPGVTRGLEFQWL
jgi:hypothetical protein